MVRLTKGQVEAWKATIKEYLDFKEETLKAWLSIINPKTPEKQMKPKIKKFKYSCECQSFEVNVTESLHTKNVILANNYICTKCGHNMFCETVYESIPESLEEKLNDWLDKNNGKFPSAEAWRKALIKDFISIAKDHKEI